jgi:hypothetical protein
VAVDLLLYAEWRCHALLVNMQALCGTIRAELENDRLIAETGVYPPQCDLPVVTAPEYCHVRHAFSCDTQSAVSPSQYAAVRGRLANSSKHMTLDTGDLTLFPDGQPAI